MASHPDMLLLPALRGEKDQCLCCSTSDVKDLNFVSIIAANADIPSTPPGNSSSNGAETSSLDNKEIKSLVTIPVQDILKAQVKQRTRSLSPQGTERDLRSHSLLVHYVTHLSMRRMCMVTREFCGSETECQNLADDINSRRAGLYPWVRRLLVLLNPKSGVGRAVSLYKMKVAPIFSACDVITDVIVTTAQGHAARVLETIDLSKIDGIVLVGGDGFYCEFLTAMLRHLMKHAGNDINDINCTVLPVPVPIGIVPAGTGNFLNKDLYGNKDVITAAVHIVRGNTMETKAVSLHQPGQLLCFCSLVFHFGFLGDIIRSCESSRWLGPIRYSFIPQATLLKRRLADVSIKLYPFRKIPTKEYDCVDSTDHTFNWRNDAHAECLNGEIYNMATYISKVLVKDGSLQTNLESDILTTQIVHKCTLSNLVKHLVKIKDFAPGCNDFECVTSKDLEGYSVELKSSALKQTWYFNCDGESVTLSADRFYVRSHPRIVRLFRSETPP